MKNVYYIAIGGYVGSPYHLIPHWTHYLLVWTDTEVKKMYAKYFLKDNNLSCTFREYLKSHYEDHDEDYMGEDITDDMIMDFLDDKHFDINKKLSLL